MGTDIDPSVCPACGEQNVCGLSQGKTECWCFSMKIEEAALARIPSDKKNLACLCAKCAASSGDSPPRPLKCPPSGIT
jgi:hypothetical protein